MDSKLAVRNIGLALIAAGVLLFALSLALGGKFNIALPVLFLMLGAATILLVFAFSGRWAWAGLLFIPGGLLLALGLIFLLNTLTGDWAAWAYAWLLLPAGAGVGLALTAAYLNWDQKYQLIGAGATVAALALFAGFGAIAGGMFLLAAAPLLLVLIGAALFWARPAWLLPAETWSRLRLRAQPPAPAAETAQPQAAPAAVEPLIEPLSPREMEVLRLIDQGLTNAAIAARLTVAESTVKTHINNIYGKMAVQGRVQAVRRARELGLLP